MPLVSVVVPAYNRIEMLREAIQSVLEQTLGDYEIIIVDDGSDRPIACSLGIEDGRLRYVRQANYGAAYARNRGIEAASGRFVAFLDSDDTFVPQKLEKQVSVLCGNPDVMWSHTSYQTVDVEGTFIREVCSGSLSGKIYPDILGTCPIATPTVMVRRELFRNRLGFNESLRVAEDVVLWVQIAKKHQVIGINEPLTRVRIDERTASCSDEAQRRGLLIVVDQCIRRGSGITHSLRRRLLAEKYYQIAVYSARLRMLWSFLRFIIHSIFLNPFAIRLYLYRLVRTSFCPSKRNGGREIPSVSKKRNGACGSARP